ncbi:MAG: SDR family NAD(P)-dependent oxidoreductase [bacterium]|nr:SDR family NAD(P)-dependent oxidoreductase [bacterium]MDE0352789.1 SDR family NAD(P)-dependent oxidoreductase [bacterium]
MGVSGRVAVVTGAASGQGRATSLQLAGEGALVAALDVDAAGLESLVDEVSATGARCRGLQVDVSDAEAVATAFAEIEADLGRAYVLAAAAAIYPPGVFSHLRDPEETARIFDVNLMGVVHCASAATSQMIEEGRGGRIVLWSSIGAGAAIAGHAAYCAGKAAIEGLGRALAAELGPYGITVNTIAPGAIDTPMLGTPPDPAYFEVLPAGRAGTPEEVAHLVSYLCSDASGFMTGAVLALDGGLSGVNGAVRPEV